MGTYLCSLDVLCRSNEVVPCDARHPISGYVSKNYFSHVRNQRSPLLQLARVDVGEGLPLAHRLVQLLEGVVHHELGLLPLEVGFHDPVAHLLVLVQRLLQLVLLHRAVLTAKYPD